MIEWGCEWGIFAGGRVAREGSFQGGEETGVEVGVGENLVDVGVICGS